MKNEITKEELEEEYNKLSYYMVRCGLLYLLKEIIREDKG
jgi:hypothetical protein|tara:strand:- start:2092 stop:2211 length:120 start_codon:yes stop_codon:yes gene_type:complete